MKLKLLFTFILVLLLSSCKHEPSIENAPQISYSNDVNPIIMNNCAQSGCHGAINPGQFSLLGYDNLIKGGEVKAGDPKSSKLYNSIISLEEDDLMPRSPYSRLGDDKIKTVYLWILQGAKNN
jgi:hypothetical protein